MRLYGVGCFCINKVYGEDKGVGIIDMQVEMNEVSEMK